jgi:hypothetical protein
MALLIRRFLAIVSACGLAAAVLIYAGSIMGTTMDSIFRWAIFLHIGVFVLLLPMYSLEYSAIRSRTFFWKSFAEGQPKWTVRSIQLFGLFLTFHFLFFLAQSRAAAPKIKDGECVLDSHGQTVRVLSASEYRSLKGSELRPFATGWMFFYFVR